MPDLTLNDTATGAEVRAPGGSNDAADQFERKYQAVLKELAEKESFNFALFQYSPISTVVVDRDGRVVKSNIAKRSAGDRIPEIGDIMYRDYASHHSIDMYEDMMRCMREGIIGRYPSMPYGNKFLAITIAPFPNGAIITCQDITEQKRAEQDRMALIAQLLRALDEVETLRGLLPICASCKNIRDDRGYWSTVEEYFTKHMSVDFSHTVCPKCMKKLYPELWKKMHEKEAIGK